MRKELAVRPFPYLVSALIGISTFSTSSWISTGQDPYSRSCRAKVSTSKTGANLQAGAFTDNAVIPYAGIQATKLDDDQRQGLLNLIGVWVGKMDDGHAAIKMDEVTTYLDETWLAWIGGTELESVFYYRIHSPVILIEFDHQAPGPLGQDSDFYSGSMEPSRFHIHAIMRTPNGNDYGKDLLAEHYATSPHHATPTL